MSKSENIRELARQGFSVTEIARKVGVRYQHAYNVVKNCEIGKTPNGDGWKEGIPAEWRSGVGRPALSRRLLIIAGFVNSGEWQFVDGALRPSEKLPKARGVYAFLREDSALYVGVAMMGLAKRLYFYSKPGATQRTSLRIGAALSDQVRLGNRIEIFTASPPDLEWNGLPVSGAAGLEQGLIRNFLLPWNKRGT